MALLFQNHLDLSKQYFMKLLQPGDLVIDATCGNGHDTAFLASLILREDQGALYALDIQDQALISAKKKLMQELPEETLQRIHFVKRCHSMFPEEIQKHSVKLIVYNLGYLPHGDKTLTTKCATTLTSLENGLALISDSGAISITCYPGHQEGEAEEKAVLDFAAQLDPKHYMVCHHRFLNRDKAPSLLLIQAK